MPAELVDKKRMGDCCICLEPLVGQKVTTLACASAVRHRFHESCLLEYRLTSSGSPLKCPICRQPYLATHSDTWRKIATLDMKYSRARPKGAEFGKMGRALVEAYRAGTIDSSDVDTLARSEAFEIAIEAVRRRR